MKQLHLMTFDDAIDRAWEAAWASNEAFDMLRSGTLEGGRGVGWASEPIRPNSNSNRMQKFFTMFQETAGLVMGQPEDGDPQIPAWSYEPSKEAPLNLYLGTTALVGEGMRQPDLPGCSW